MSDKSICEGYCDSIIPVITSIPNSKVDIFWTPTGKGAKIQVCTESSTEYFISVTNGYGCSDTISTRIYVNKNPVTDAGSDRTICYGVLDTLRVKISDNPGGCTYTWSEGNVHDSVLPIFPEKLTEYYVTVKNSAGCKSIDSVKVIVSIISVKASGDKTICDNMSDTVDAIISKNLEGEIYYEWHDINGGWDGKYNGNPVEGGVYLYYVNALGSNKEIHRQYGHVNVLR